MPLHQFVSNRCIWCGAHLRDSGYSVPCPIRPEFPEQPKAPDSYQPERALPARPQEYIRARLVEQVQGQEAALREQESSTGCLVVFGIVGGALVLGFIITLISLATESKEEEIARLERLARQANHAALDALAKGDLERAQRKNDAAKQWIDQLNEVRRTPER